MSAGFWVMLSPVCKSLTLSPEMLKNTSGSLSSSFRCLPLPCLLLLLFPGVVLARVFSFSNSHDDFNDCAGLFSYNWFWRLVDCSGYRLYTRLRYRAVFFLFASCAPIQFCWFSLMMESGIFYFPTIFIVRLLCTPRLFHHHLSFTMAANHLLSPGLSVFSLLAPALSHPPYLLIWILHYASMFLFMPHTSVSLSLTPLHVHGGYCCCSLMLTTKLWYVRTFNFLFLEAFLTVQH